MGTSSFVLAGQRNQQALIQRRLRELYRPLSNRRKLRSGASGRLKERNDKKFKERLLVPIDISL
jgi:hypothetical protein